MAYKLQAVGELAPQVVSAGAVHDGDLLEDMTEDTGISEGEALQVKRTLVRRLGRDLARGRTVHVDDLGTFFVDIDLKGHLSVHFKADPDLTDFIQSNFRGEIKNAENIGKTLADLIALWNANPEHVNDQIAAV